MLRILRKTQRVGVITEPLPEDGELALEQVGAQLKARVGEMFGGSLAIREVDAGSCNGCELEIHALNNPYYGIPVGTLTSLESRIDVDAQIDAVREKCGDPYAANRDLYLVQRQVEIDRLRGLVITHLA